MVNVKCVLDGLRHFNAKFVGLFQKSWITLLHKQDNPVPLFENMRDPPVESWFMVETNYLGVFRGLDGGGFLQVGKVIPGRGSVLPLAANLPADG